ncbi:MAG: branched-chain amino acid ABC transporter substrate-binding protein [Propionibacteriaceae bacterium]|nr:branched-chain amino acid ABC transporter substrate-binding protein [Propionibacteriaceae bacterium]
MKAYKAAAILTLAASLALATGCGSRTEPTTTEGSGETEDKVAKIGVIAPLTGDLSSFGKGIQYSVQLAVKQANESGAIPGWTLEVVPLDDQATPDVGQNAANQLASMDDVIALVGTMNSSVAQPVQPIVDAANIAMVSPANTNTSLTKGADLENPVRPYKSFYRLCASDDKQGPFAAKYLLTKGIKTAATVHDKKVYGQGLVDAFTEYYEANGGKVVAAETINPEDTDYSTVVTKVKSANPEIVYYGGEYPQGAPLSAQMKDAGLKVAEIGGDGNYTTEYQKLAGEAAEGDLTTSVGAPLDTLDSAKAYLDGYAAGGYDVDPGAYGGYAYDAANVIIEALKTTLKDAADVKSAREATVAAIQNVKIEGATGEIAFDEFGDNTNRVLTVYKSEGDAWVSEYINTIE